MFGRFPRIFKEILIIRVQAVPSVSAVEFRRKISGSGFVVLVLIFVLVVVVFIVRLKLCRPPATAFVRRGAVLFPGIGTATPRVKVVQVTPDHLDIRAATGAAAVVLLDELGVRIAGERIEFLIYRSLVFLLVSFAILFGTNIAKLFLP